MKAGFARAVITPPVGSSLVGYFEDRRSTGIRDHLYASAAVFDDGKTAAAIVACDLVWVDEPTVAAVRKLVEKKTGIPGANVIVHGTHTHTGPVCSKPTHQVYTRGFYVEPCYLDLLPHHIAGSVLAAWNARAERNVGAGSAPVKNIAFNRRYVLADGRVVTNPVPTRDAIVGSAGPADGTVRFILFTDAKKRPVAVIVNFALHPDTLGDTLISSDWPGAMRRRIESRFPGVAAILVNGPSGDINHLNPKDYETRSPDIGERIGRTIADAVCAALPKVRTGAVRTVSAARAAGTVPYRRLDPARLAAAEAYLETGKKGTLRYLQARSMVNLRKEAARKRSLPAEAGGLAFGRGIAIVALPGEIFTQIGMDIRAASPFAATLLAQNSNGHLNYVPSEKAFADDAHNYTLRPEYDEVNLAEAIGINCSYETSYVSCRLDARAGRTVTRRARTVLTRLAA